VTLAALSTSAPTAQSDIEAVEPSLLPVESDPALAGELLEQLRTDGYRTLHARTSIHAHVLVHGHSLRAVVLGTLESPRAVLDLLAEIRGVPVLVLGYSDAQIELLRAFEMGADDFIARERYSYLELRARLKALLRRSACSNRPNPVRVGAIEIDAGARQARVAGTPVVLSRLEYELLTYLARDPRRVCSKQELLRAVWGFAASAGTRTVDSHASRLRRKLEAAGAGEFVVNVWSVGYRLI
jgi:DNA-binding response OmpR family regulator